MSWYDDTAVPHKKTMPDAEIITQKEWERLNFLRKEISKSPVAVSSSDLEEFSSLFAKSIRGKGDTRQD
jgi:hypothetical protein